MDKRAFGRTGLEVSLLTFGCGAVGGLMVKGDDLPEPALRYAISNRALPTTEIGIATIDELQRAAAAVNRGPLPGEALARIKQIQASFAA